MSFKSIITSSARSISAALTIEQNRPKKQGSSKGNLQRLNNKQPGAGLNDMFEFLKKVEATMKGRAKQDIATWIAAYDLARNPINPKRQRLYMIYDDVNLDDQVVTVIGNMVAQVMCEDWYITKPNSTEKDDAATALFMKAWFYDTMQHAIEQEADGHRLIEYAPPVKIDNELEFVHMERIPKEHVIPEWGLIVARPGDDTGINYRTHPLYPKTLLEIGKPAELGRLLQAARPALYKKNMEASWSQFGEMFGLPLRIGKVASRNQDDFDRMEDFMKNMGKAAYAVTGADDVVELKESSKGDAYQVFSQYLDRADRAISKIFLGQTMTTDNGSSKSQAEVHERVSIARMLMLKLKLDLLINSRVLPLAALNGFPLKQGQRFRWNVVEELSELDIAADEFLVSNFEFKDLEYFIKKYGVPITGLRMKDATGEKGDKVVKEALSRINKLRKQMHHDSPESCC